jgi:Zn-finger nucleic acid-binding protein
MNCPKCRTNELIQRKLKDKDVTVEYCRRCKGIWFDKEELETVLAVAIKELDIPGNALQLTLLCPKCKKSLYQFYYPQTYVTIEMCRKCKGFWLDSGEFQEIRKVRSFLKDSGQMKEYAELEGVKGSLIKFINSALDDLSDKLFHS